MWSLDGSTGAKGNKQFVGVGNACERSEQGVTGPNNDAGPFALSSLPSPSALNHAL
jgi:hypothetical protein